jgi:hypothetical protein
VSFNLDDYEPVSARLARWLEATDGKTQVLTDLVHRGDDWCMFKASLYVDGLLIATGYAEEHVTERGVNSTSHVENCETSAVGRALANAGFAGSDPSKRPSREEMTKVQRAGGQPAQYTSKPSGVATEKQRTYIADLCRKLTPPIVPAIPGDLTSQDAAKLIDILKQGKLPPVLDQGDEEPF